MTDEDGGSWFANKLRDKMRVKSANILALSEDGADDPPPWSASQPARNEIGGLRHVCYYFSF